MKFLDTDEQIYTIEFKHKELIAIMNLLGELTDQEVLDHGLNDAENDILTEVHAQLTDNLVEY